MNSNTASAKLMIIISDYLSRIVEKGEILDGYYNPSDMFAEVHIVMIHDDRIEPGSEHFRAVQKMVGSAKLFLYNLPKPGFIESLAWSHLLLKNWVNKALTIVHDIKPNVIRTYNNFLDGYLAAEIKKHTGIPYIVSLHGVWDSDCLISWKEKVRKYFLQPFEEASLKNADAIIAVYKPAADYALRYGARQVNLIYNKTAQNKINPKTDYRLSNPPRLITVNRQIRDKNPENIIKAVKNLDCSYHLVGNGELHEYLISLSGKLNCSEKIKYEKSIPNELLCKKLPEYDIMVLHCDYLGIPKSVIEAAFAGLPIIVNRHPSRRMPDYEGEWAKICENTPQAYHEAIKELIADEQERRRLGEAAKAFAEENFASEIIDRKTKDLYYEVMIR